MRQDEIHTADELRYVRNERLLVAVYLLCVMAVQAHFVHDGWYTLLHPAVMPAPPHMPVREYAPEVYRAGMRVVNRALQKVIGNDSARLTLIDFLLGYPALYGFYLVQSSGISLRPQARAYRIGTLAFFLAAIHFPLVWVVPYQRPETMAMALYLAAATLLLLRMRSGAGWAFALLALTVVTAFFRSDVPCIFGAAIFLLAVCGNALHELTSRRTCLILGASLAVAAASVQAYLQFIRFPGATYPQGVPVVMLHYNARFHSIASLLIVLLPLIAMACAAFATRVKMRSVDWLCITASALYLPLWFIVGSTAEVRIYVPFLLLLCPPAARIMAAVLGLGGTNNEPLEA